MIRLWLQRKSDRSEQPQRAVPFAYVQVTTLGYAFVYDGFGSSYGIR